MSDFTPTRRPSLVTDEDPRCWACGRKLAVRATRPWVIDCGKCKETNQAVPEDPFPRPDPWAAIRARRDRGTPPGPPARTPEPISS